MKMFIKNNYRYFLTIAFLLGLLLIAGFFFYENVFRIFYSLNNTYGVLRYLFVQLFKNKKIYPEFNYAQIIENFGYKYNEYLPSDWNEFGSSFVLSLRFLIMLDFYGLFLGNASEVILSILLILLCLVLIIPIYILIKELFFKENGKTGDSHSLVRFKAFEKKYLIPINQWIKDEIDFIKNCRFYTLFKWIFIVEIAYMCNALPFLLTAFSGIYYFLLSYDVRGLFDTVFALYLFLIDLVHTFSIPGLIVILLIAFYLFRKNRAYKKLNRMEGYNRVFINELGVLTGVFGTPGAGKTQLVTDMSISSLSMFREEALDILNEVHLLFPLFPLIKLERWIDKQSFKNKVQAKYAFQSYYDKHKRSLFGYKLNPKSTLVYDSLKIHHLRDDLSDYTMAYYLYRSSLLLSTYSIRIDRDEMTLGHFAIYQDNYFHADGSEFANPLYSKVLDYDAFRVGKKFVFNNPYSNLLDGCVCSISEISKERGNTLENKELKKLDDEANQKNDGFNETLKLIRHLTTIRYRCFFKGFWDDQRLGSLGTDVNSLCESNIWMEKKNSEYKSAFMLLWLLPMALEFIVNSYKRFYVRYRFFREDNTVFTYLYSKLAKASNLLLLYFNNTFGYRVQPLKLSHGNIDGSISVDEANEKYYLMNKKIFADRYSTACYEAFRLKEKNNATHGINERASFSDLVASTDELRSEHSYFIDRLLVDEEIKDEDVLASSDGKEVSSVSEEANDFFDFGGGLK